MRLGTSSPLKHTTPGEWADNQIKLGCRTVVFPVQSNESESILEHLDSDDEYIRYMKYLQKVLA